MGVGEYLRSACGREEAAATGRRIGDDARAGRSRSAMFSVSSFVPVRANDDECEYEYGESDDDASTSFAVEAKRVYGDESPGARRPAPLDSTADWLSRVVSESDEDEEENEDNHRHHWSAHRFEEALTMISPIRSTVSKPPRDLAADSTTDEDASSDEFHSLEEDFPILRSTTGTTASSSFISSKMRLARASPNERSTFRFRRLGGVPASRPARIRPTSVPRLSTVDDDDAATTTALSSSPTTMIHPSSSPTTTIAIETKNRFVRFFSPARFVLAEQRQRRRASSLDYNPSSPMPSTDARAGEVGYTRETRRVREENRGNDHGYQEI